MNTNRTIKTDRSAVIRHCGLFFVFLQHFLRAGGTKSAPMPPYNEYVVLGPAQPDETAQKMSQCLGGIKVAITDINDLEGQILGTSDPSMDRDLLVKILKDNPLGQSLEQTPIGIIRKVK